MRLDLCSRTDWLRVLLILRSLRKAIWVSATILTSTSVSSSYAQTTPATTPQQTFVAQAVAAFSHAIPLSSLVLTGTATRSADKFQTIGSVKFVGRSDGSGTADIQVGEFVERENYPAYPAPADCIPTSHDSLQRQAPPHRCVGATLWFLPQMALLQSATDSKLAVEPLPDASSGVLLYRLRNPSLRFTASQMKELSASKLIIDPTNMLVRENTFTIYPNNRPEITLTVHVLYSDYFTSNGVTVPGRIRRYIGGTLQLDIHISSAVLVS